jgi:nucleotide-binding universal stress UspA family protein
MLNKIVVPLDGSDLAECALPYAEEIASKTGAEVVLISVTERVQGYKTMRDPTQPLEVDFLPVGVGKMETQATHYLDKIAKKFQSKGIKVTQEVLLGNPAEEIIIYVELKKCDLIIMSTHGRSGTSRWLHGSVAEKVFRVAGVPIMMIPASVCPPIKAES